MPVPRCGSAAAGDDIRLIDDRLALGLVMTTQKRQLPCAFQWQYFLCERGEMIRLGAGEGRDHASRLAVLDGPERIAATESRIRTLARQPEDDYSGPSGTFRPLPWARAAQKE
jgi:hypothetical protein